MVLGICLAALSGCISATIDSNEARVVAATGSVRGRVVNDAGLGLAGAGVRILETDIFAAADENGRFEFPNLTSGFWRLHAIAPGFRENITQIEVTPDNTTEITIFLLPLESRGAGYVPHTHDYWGDSNEYVLMDHDVTFGNDVRYSNTNDTPYSNTGLPIYLPRAEDGHPSIIVPGTKTLRVTLSWSSPSVTFEKLGIWYINPQLSKDAWTPRVAGPVASGQTINIPVERDAQDFGHQQWTSWRFWLCSCQAVQSPTTWKPAAITGPIHIKMVLVKGDLFLEPEHRDFWGDTIEKRLRDFGAYQEIFYVNVNQRDTYSCLPLPKEQLVPPSTSRMRVEFRWRYATANNTPADGKYSLGWRTGSQNPFYTPFSALGRAPPVVEGDHFLVYEFPVKPGESDAFYGKSSNWCFYPTIKGFENDNRNMDRAASFDFRVTVWRDGATA